ncbi:MAG TPA: ABC transporter ATP-binding protein [Clostridiaceae bacterium]|nr:ABC transporter ATP-binding protein [Clostridiaceae bacterium]
MLKKFVSYYKPHMGLFIADLVCAFLMASIDLLFPIITRYVTQKVIPAGNILLMFKIIGVLIIAYLIRLGLNYFVNYYGHIVGIRMEYDMRRDLFSHLQTLSFKFYDNVRTGHLMSRMMNDLNEITELAHHGPEDIFLSTIMLAGSVIILSTIEWRLTLVVFVIVVIMAWFAITKRSKMSAAFREVRKKIANINSQLESSISGIRVSQAFTNEDYEKKKFNKGNEEFKVSKNESYKYMAQYASGIDFISDMLNVSVIGIGGYFVYTKLIDFGDLLAFLLYINLAVQPVRRLAQFVQQFESGMTGFERFVEIMEVKPEIVEKENAIELKNIKGHIEFKNVTFSYNKGKNVLKNISLTIPAGKVVALVGPSGGGKTTLCNLIPRFYDVESGSIEIDGHDIRDLTLKSLRENIGIVQQDVFLFAGTIKENILYGKVDASDEEVIEAAKRASIHDFVMSLPDKYDTYVGERGIQLSGGQKQRIAIARVFLKNPPILILDEATSALDNETEVIIQESLEELSKGRTTLVIAHRLSTIRNADQIIVIDKDGIKEMGTHEELMALNGLYAKLYKYGDRTDKNGNGFNNYEYLNE